jgi:hypothetical protein
MRFSSRRDLILCVLAFIKPTYNWQYWHLPSNKISFLCEKSYNCLGIAVDMCIEEQKYHVKERKRSQRIGRFPI